MPIRITGGQGADCKACGIHNGTKGWLRGWSLHEDDKKALQQNSDTEVVLSHLPQVLWIETVEDLKEQHKNAPHKNWFPLKPVTNLWTLDAAEHMEITRKGFCAVPDFSSTIHVATGRTLKACLPDLGGLMEPPSLTAMMRGYIALSRATDADGILVARPFSPMLFQQGEQPFPTLLLRVLQGQIREEEVPLQCFEAQQRSKKTKEEKLLKHKSFKCGGSCNAMKPGQDFVAGLPGDFGKNFLERVLAPGPFRRCLQCTSEKSGMAKTHQCKICQLHLSKAYFAFDEWGHFDKNREIRCEDCSNPLCSAPGCKTCPVCRDIACSGVDSMGQSCQRRISFLAKYKRPGSQLEKEHFRCDSCAGRILVCFVCRTTAEERFSNAVRRKKAERYATSRCIDCAHPRCSNPSCPTCKTCRHPRCTEPGCVGDVLPLNSKQMPKTEAERDGFLCAPCKEAAAARFACTGCKKKLPGEHFEGEDIAAKRRYPGRKKLLCRSCDEKGFTTNDPTLYRLTDDSNSSPCSLGC